MVNIIITVTGSISTISVIVMFLCRWAEIEQNAPGKYAGLFGIAAIVFAIAIAVLVLKILFGGGGNNEQ